MAARNRYLRFLGKQRSNANVTLPLKPTGSSTRLEKTLSYSGVIANVSQVFMLVVVVFGRRVQIKREYSPPI